MRSPTDQPTDYHIHPSIDWTAVQTCAVHLRDLDRVPPPPPGNSITHGGGQRSAGGGSIPGGRRRGHGEMGRAQPPCHTAGFMFLIFFLFSLSRVAVGVVK